MGFRSRVRRLFTKSAVTPPVRLTAISSRAVSPRYAGVNIFGVVRNELDLLPHWLKHYRSLGAERFFVVDNGSTDGSLEFLSKQEDVHLFQSHDSFQSAAFGSRWAEFLASEYGSEQWWVFADIDEFLVFPHFETTSLPRFVEYLDSEGARAVFGILVDMYANKPLSEAKPGKQGVFVDFPYFDADNIISNAGIGYGNSGAHFTGGARGRVFKLSVCLNKIPLVKYRKGDKLYGGWHFTDILPVSSTTAAVLHFKFTDRFLKSAVHEVQRKEHWLGGGEYARYHSYLNSHPDPNLYTESSTRFQSSETLLRVGLMSTNESWTRLAGSQRSRLAK